MENLPYKIVFWIPYAHPCAGQGIFFGFYSVLYYNHDMLKDSFLWTTGELVCPSVCSEGDGKILKDHQNSSAALFQIVVVPEQIKVPPKLWTLPQPRDCSTTGHGLTGFAGACTKPECKTRSSWQRKLPHCRNSITDQLPPTLLHYALCVAVSKWAA